MHCRDYNLTLTITVSCAAIKIDRNQNYEVNLAADSHLAGSKMWTQKRRHRGPICVLHIISCNAASQAEYRVYLLTDLTVRVLVVGCV